MCVGYIGVGLGTNTTLAERSIACLLRYAKVCGCYSVTVLNWKRIFD